MENRIITDNTHLENFANAYTDISGHQPGLEYLKNASKVRAFYDKDNNFFGGYVVNANKPLRMLDDIIKKRSHLISKYYGR